MAKKDSDWPHDNQGGYAERGPGRGDHAGRGRGESTAPHPRNAPEEREPSERSRWRDDDPDARSERWKEDDGESGVTDKD